MLGRRDAARVSWWGVWLEGGGDGSTARTGGSAQRWLAAARALSPHAPARKEQHPARSPGGKPQRLRFILQLRSTCTALAERLESGRWISR